MELKYLTYLEILSGILELIVGIGSIILGSSFQGFISSFMSVLPTKYVPTFPSFFNSMGLIGDVFGLAFIVLAVSSFIRAWMFMKT
jgi:hypothetical protein